MTAFNFGSPTGNVIVPVSNFTQQTKELDITNYVTSSVGTINTSTARAVFSADSSGAWHISLNIGITYSTVVNMSGGNNITIGGIYFKYVNNNYAATVAAFSSAGTPVAAQVEAIANHAYFTTYTAATDIQYFRITYSGPLLAEPIWASLGTTALAAKEGNVNVSAYFPVASGTTPGLVDGNAATWNGVYKCDGILSVPNIDEEQSNIIIFPNPVNSNSLNLQIVNPVIKLLNFEIISPLGIEVLKGTVLPGENKKIINLY